MATKPIPERRQVIERLMDLRDGLRNNEPIDVVKSIETLTEALVVYGRDLAKVSWTLTDVGKDVEELKNDSGKR